MTQLGAELVADIWANFEAAGALSTATYTRITPATSTDITDGDLEDVVASTNIKILTRRYRAFEIDGARIQSGDLEFMFPKTLLTFEPDVDDQATRAGRTYRVIYPGEGPDGAMWRLQVRSP